MLSDVCCNCRCTLLFCILLLFIVAMPLVCVVGVTNACIYHKICVCIDVSDVSITIMRANIKYNILGYIFSFES